MSVGRRCAYAVENTTRKIAQVVFGTGVSNCWRFSARLCDVRRYERGAVPLKVSVSCHGFLKWTLDVATGSKRDSQ